MQKYGLLFAAFFSLYTCSEAALQGVGEPGPSGWKCHVVQPDPMNDGPDGINAYDWDGDGELDLFVNYEEGCFSRLYFNPGSDKVRKIWPEYIEFKHGKSEDSGIGDLDHDGDVDYIANGGWIYFNPGSAAVHNPDAWEKMTLFDEQERVPTVWDVDGDGLNDLIVGAKRWYRQPATNKHVAANWTCYELGAAKWAMSCIPQDMDGDGDFDLLVQERKKQGTFYYVNPGREKATEPWAVKTIDPTKGCMFMVSGDVNGDGRPDLVKADPPYISIFIKTNDAGPPVYKEVKVEQPKQPDSVSVQAKPKGVALMELNGDPSRPEIMVIPEYEAQLWFLTVHGDGMAQENWACTLMDIPYPESRKKMDNVYLADVDGDGDLDVVTTEENGGWGVIWFENPERKK